MITQQDKPVYWGLGHSAWTWCPKHPDFRPFWL